MYPFCQGKQQEDNSRGCIWSDWACTKCFDSYAYDGVLEGTKIFQVKWDVKDKFGNSITNNYVRNWISAMSFHKSEIYHNPSGPGIAINELDWIVYVLLCSTRNRTHHDQTVYWDPVGIIDNSQVYMELTEVNSEFAELPHDDGLNSTFHYMLEGYTYWWLC